MTIFQQFLRTQQHEKRKIQGMMTQPPPPPPPRPATDSGYWTPPVAPEAISPPAPRLSPRRGGRKSESRAAGRGGGRRRRVAAAPQSAVAARAAHAQRGPRPQLSEPAGCPPPRGPAAPSRSGPPATPPPRGAPPSRARGPSSAPRSKRSPGEFGCSAASTSASQVTRRPPSGARSLRRPPPRVLQPSRGKMKRPARGAPLDFEKTLLPPREPLDPPAAASGQMIFTLGRARVEGPGLWGGGRGGSRAESPGCSCAPLVRGLKGPAARLRGGSGLGRLCLAEHRTR
ncbi:unnamed protein product [Nyctereutes procyonoides]|uniref:(raccoon dog) hypothetical protein n=1 Tax=Nyctereutes procyonoides TaxID=34880 RepID=A0A811YI66_NYCPR|nr:unnamed protein product [Nyctereutes procyonoides]